MRWSLDASDELGLTPCFTVPADPIAAPAATTAGTPPGTIVPEAASPFRAPAPAPFLVPSLPPLPFPTTAGGRGLSSVVVAAPPRMGAPRVTGVVAVDWLAAGTRLSGEEVVHFNSMTSFRAVWRWGFVSSFSSSPLLLGLHNNKQTIFSLFTTHLGLTSTQPHTLAVVAHSLPKLLSLCWTLKSIFIAEPEPERHQLLQSSDAYLLSVAS